MFKIQNIAPGNVPLMLENKGSIVLMSGQYLDLDLHCSRAWIKTNHDLKVFISTGTFRLVHDSVNDVIPSQPIKPILRTVPKEPVVTPKKNKKEKKKIKPEIIDLSAKADPTEDEFVIEAVLEDVEIRFEDPVEQAILESLDE